MKYTGILFLLLFACTNTETRTKKHPSGQLMYSEEYKDGSQHGQSLYFAPNGDTVAMHNYVNGKQNGVQTIYIDYGTTSVQKSIYFVVDDVRHGSDSSFYSNGQLSSVGQFQNGKQEGIWQHYHENGEFWFESNWKNGNQEGPLNSFHPNGNKETECMIVGGKLEGTASFYDSTGTLTHQIIYEHSKPLDTIKNLANIR